MTQGRTVASFRLVPLLALLVCAPAVSAGNDKFEIGPRITIVTAGGEPANDIISAGIFGRVRVNERWHVGFAIDQAEFDFERPAKAVGLQQDPAIKDIDSTVDSTTISGWIEREYGDTDRRFSWFWTAGLGANSPDAGDVTGPLAGGGMFDITTDPGSELILSGSAGVRRRLGQRLSLQFDVRVDHHLADWKVMDRVSTNAATIDDYTGFGGQFGLAYRF